MPPSVVGCPAAESVAVRSGKTSVRRVALAGHEVLLDLEPSMPWLELVAEGPVLCAHHGGGIGLGSRIGIDGVPIALFPACSSGLVTDRAGGQVWAPISTRAADLATL